LDKFKLPVPHRCVILQTRTKLAKFRFLLFLAIVLAEAKPCGLIRISVRSRRASLANWIFSRGWKRQVEVNYGCWRG